MLSRNDSGSARGERQHRHYVYLLVGLVAYLVVTPVADVLFSDSTRLKSDVILLVSLVLGMKGVVTTRRSLLWLGSLIGLVALMGALHIGTGSPAIGQISLIVLLLFCLSVTLIILRDVLFGGPIDLNRLFGSVCVYLLIGLAWAILYAVLDIATDHHLFSTTINPNLRLGVADIHAYVYYSFVTLTTLGFGDITPIDPITKNLTFLEAAVGQLYLAILIAALVGKIATVTRETGSSDDSD